MAVCDTCNEPGMGTLVGAGTFRAAIQNGFCPFRLGLDDDMGMAEIREEWRREALASTTDWNLCDACYSKFQPYEPKATAALGVTQTHLAGRSVVQLETEHELAVAQAVLRGDLVEPEVLEPYGQLFQVTKLLAPARVAALEIELEAHKTGRPASSFAGYGNSQVKLEQATNIVKLVCMRAEKNLELNGSTTMDEKKPLLKAEIDELNAEIAFHLQRLTFLVDGKWKLSWMGIGAKRIIYTQEAQDELSRLTRIHQSIIVRRASEQLRYVYATSPNVSDRDRKALSTTLKVADIFREKIGAARGEGDAERLKRVIDEAFKLTPQGAQNVLFRQFMGSYHFDKSDCFIATAAWGSDQVEDVVILRAFRDRVLHRSRAGLALVRVYECVSPPMARWISRSELARSVVRGLLRRITATIQWSARAADLRQAAGLKSIQRRERTW